MGTSSGLAMREIMSRRRRLRVDWYRLLRLESYELLPGKPPNAAAPLGRAVCVLE